MVICKKCRSGAGARDVSCLIQAAITHYDSLSSFIIIHPVRRMTFDSSRGILRMSRDALRRIYVQKQPPQRRSSRLHIYEVSYSAILRTVSALGISTMQARKMVGKLDCGARCLGMFPRNGKPESSRITTTGQSQTRNSRGDYPLGTSRRAGSS